jgi:hypothetical protein
MGTAIKTPLFRNATVKHAARLDAMGIDGFSCVVYMDGMDFEHTEHGLSPEFLQAWDDMVEFLDKNQRSGDAHLVNLYRELYFLGASKSITPNESKGYITKILEEFSIQMPPLLRG